MKRFKTMRPAAWLCLLLGLMLLALPLRAAAAPGGDDMAAESRKAVYSAENGSPTAATDGEGTSSAENGSPAATKDGEDTSRAESAGTTAETEVSKTDGSGAADPDRNDGQTISAEDDGESNVGVSVEKEGGSSENLTFSDKAVRFFGDNCAELLSALTLVSSLAIALLFKKGLLPALSAALKGLAGGLSQGVDEMGKMGEKLSQDTGAAMQRFTAAVSPALNEMKSIAARADAMAERTKALEAALAAADGSRARMETVLRAQSELFYRFFMSANLPQYQKDALGEAYEKMSRLLTADGAEGSHEAESRPQ